MEATKFEAMSIRDAIKLVKQELGKDAVIISTKQADRTLPGNRIQKIYEVLATPAVSKQAFSEKPSPAIRKPEFPRIATGDKATIVRNTPPSKSPLDGSQRSRAELYEKASGSERIRTATSAPANSEANVAVGEIKRAGDQISESINQIRRDMQRLPQFDFGEQLQEVKLLLHDVLRSQAHPSASPNLHPATEDICLKLRIAGVLPSIISDLQCELERVCQAGKEESNTEDRILSTAIKYILRQLKVNPSVFQTDSSQGIHCFIGSSGVGKTSTLAKIAAHLRAKHNHNVCVINQDSQKLASSDQLRVYSKILGFDFKSCDQIQQLEEQVEKSYDSDSILIDTAGRPANLREQIEYVTSLQESRIPIKFHLVLSATTKQRDIEESIRAYRHVDISSVIFSKLDESWSFGEMLNTSCTFGSTLSYFTTGPGIPEDLEPATKERVIERLLKI